MPPSANDIVVRVIPDIQAAGGSISSQFKKVANPIKKIVGDALGEALDTAWSPRALGKVQKNLAKIEVEAVKARETASIKAAAIDRRLRKKHLGEDEKIRLQSAKKEANLEAKNLEDRLKKEAGAVSAAAKRSKDAETQLKAMGAEVSKLSSASAERFGESLAGAFADLSSGDLGNMSGLIKKIGEGTKKQGLNAQAKADTGEAGKLMGTLGGFLTKIGPALIAIGAIAGGLAAIAKLIMDVDEKAKDLNKTMLESGLTGLEVAGALDDVEAGFTKIRKAFTDFNLNRIWGTTPEDHIKILGAYSEAGFTFKEVTKGAANAAEEMERLQDATIMTLKYSKLLGAGTDEMAGNIGMWMEELGKDMKSVEEGLGAITIAARGSGFGVKRFYGMVLQATSGMSMYNVRLAETAAMLSMITKILGPQRGGAFVEGLTKGFSEEGYQDRMKRTKLVGSGKVKDELGGAASRIGKDLLRGMDTGKIAGLQAAAKAAGLDVNLVGKSTEDQTKALVAALTTAGPKKTAAFIADAEEHIGLDQTRKLEDLAKLSAGIKGGLADVAHAMSGFDMGGKLAILLNGVAAKFSKPIYELQGLERVGAAEMMGMSVEQFDELQRISGRLHSNFENTQKQAKRDAAQGKESSEAVIKQQIETQGIFAEGGKVWAAILDQDGEIARDENGKIIKEEIKNVGDYMQTQGKLLEQAVASELDEQTRLSVKIASATTAMSHTMSVGVASVLEGIYSAITSIKEWLFGDKDEKVVAEVVDRALQGVEKSLREGQEAVRMSEALIDSYRDLMQADPKNKAKHKKDLELETAALAAMQAQVAAYTAQKESLRGEGYIGSKPAGWSSTEWQTQRGKMLKGIASGGREDPMAAGQSLQSMSVQHAGMASQWGPLVQKLASQGNRKAQEAVSGMEYIPGAEIPTPKGGWTAPMEWKKEDLTMLAEALGVGFQQQWLTPIADMQGEVFQFLVKGKGTKIEGQGAEAVGESAFGEAFLKDAGEGTEYQAALLRLEEQKESRRSVRRGEFKADTQDATKTGVLAAMEDIENQKKKEQASRIGASLRAITDGGSQAYWEEAAEALMKGQMSDEVRATLLPHKGRIGELMGNTNIPGLLGGKTDDMVLQIGAGGVKFAQRVDNNDVGVFAKPGGAISKGGAGGSVNVFHLYNDGPGVMKSIEKAQRAGVLG